MRTVVAAAAAAAVLALPPSRTIVSADAPRLPSRRARGDDDESHGAKNGNAATAGVVHNSRPHDNIFRDRSSTSGGGGGGGGIGGYRGGRGGGGGGGVAAGRRKSSERTRVHHRGGGDDELLRDPRGERGRQGEAEPPDRAARGREDDVLDDFLVGSQVDAAHLNLPPASPEAGAGALGTPENPLGLGDLYAAIGADGSLLAGGEVEDEAATEVGDGDKGDDEPPASIVLGSGHMLPNTLPITPRIVGGREAPDGGFPYAISLQFGSSHVCGATLVAPDCVLTAAHCGGQYNRAVIGRHDLYSFRESLFGEHDIREIREEYPHPKYAYTDQNRDISHDFMIVKLGKSVGGATSHGNINPNSPVDADMYPPVTLNRKRNVPSKKGETLDVVGWGTTDKAGTVLSDVLKEVSLQYMPNFDCQLSGGFVGSYYYSYNGFIESNMLCAHQKGDVAEDACLGDSGGPIVVRGDGNDEPEGRGSQRSRKRDVQVGIVSFGVGCANPDFPGIYARVSDQIRWIDDTVCAISDYPPADFRCSKGVPTRKPTWSPTNAPTTSPTDDPTERPTTSPTEWPTESPSPEPTMSPETEDNGAPPLDGKIEDVPDDEEDDLDDNGEVEDQDAASGGADGADADARNDGGGNSTLPAVFNATDPGADTNATDPGMDTNATLPSTSPTLSSAPTPSPITSFPTPPPTTMAPSPSPTNSPTQSPTLRPTPSPTSSPTLRPTAPPSSNPTVRPTPVPSSSPTTRRPTAGPTGGPSGEPTDSVGMTTASGGSGGDRWTKLVLGVIIGTSVLVFPTIALLL